MTLLANRYMLHEQLGVGGMGAVFKATDRLTDQTVALKRVNTAPSNLEFASKSTDIHGEEGYRLALVREFRILASLHHPNIISVQDFGFDDEQHPFFTMQYLSKAEPILEAGLRSPVSMRLDFVLQTLQALAYLHRRGILHRDLKSSNVLVEGKTVHVLDFGLSVETQNAQALTAGTMTYMAPELLARKPASPLSDLYAVGMLAYQLLSGRYPFAYRSISELYTLIITKKVDFTILEADNDVVEVVKGLMAKNPANRYPSAEAAIQALCAAQGISVPDESSDIRDSFLTAAEFVGREGELQELLAALKRSTEGKGELWLVGGESGVGKSRLLDELRIQALTQNVWVIRGQDVPFGGALYHLWRDPLRRLVLNATLLEDQSLTLSEIIPDLPTLLGHPIVGEQQMAGSRLERLFSVLRDLLDQQNMPILLLLEDLQWARESLELLKRLAADLAERPILVVGSYRDDERPSLPLELPEGRVIKLDRLNEREIHDLSLSMLGKYGSDPKLLEFIRRETEGNVFFIVEVLRALAEEAGQFSKIPDMPLPAHISAQGIDAIIQRRLDKVQDYDDYELLTLAATLGRELDINLLRFLAAEGTGSTPNGYVNRWLSTYANLAILDFQDQRWQFAHDKLREGLLARQSADSRRDRHRMAAIAIERIYPNDPAQAFVLVTHWRGAGDLTRELHYLRLATEQAYETQSYTEMVSLGTRTLELIPHNTPEAMRLLRIVAEGYTWLSEYEPASKYYAQSLALAEDLQDPQGAAECLRHMASLSWEMGNYDHAKTYAERCLEIARQLDDKHLIAAGLNQLAGTAWLRGDYELANQYYEECLDISYESRNLPGIGVSLNYLGLLEVEYGNYGEARKKLEESLYHKRKINDQRQIAIALTNLGMVIGRLGDYDTALRYLDEAMSIERKIGNRAGLAKSTELSADIIQHKGDFATAKAMHIHAVELRRRIGERPGIVNSLIALAYSHLLLNERNKAFNDLHEALGLANQMKTTPRLIEIMVGIAWVHLLDGRALASAELLGLLVHHAKMTQDIYNTRVKLLLDQLNQKLPSEERHEALERGRNLDFEREIQKVLAQGKVITATTPVIRPPQQT